MNSKEPRSNREAHSFIEGTELFSCACFHYLKTSSIIENLYVWFAFVTEQFGIFAYFCVTPSSEESGMVHGAFAVVSGCSASTQRSRRSAADVSGHQPAVRR